MTRPNTYPLALYRGDSYGWTFRVWLDDAFTQPADLTGVTALSQVRATPGAAAVLVPMTATVRTPNLIDVSLAASSWPDPPIDRAAVWDLQLTYPSGQVITIAAGPVTITTDVTD